MAIDRVESQHFPYLPVTFTFGDGEQVVEALLDTGFDGDLALPPQLVSGGEPPDSYKTWELADGTLIEASVYWGMLRIGNLQPVAADIIALGDAPIVGRGETDRYLIILERGSRVIVET